MISQTLLKNFDKAQSQQILVLYQKKIGQRQMQYLCSKDLKNVKTLLLNNNKIDYLSIIEMRNVQWINLISINFWANLISDKGCRQLSKISFPVLNEIRLSENQISSIGANHLQKSKWPILSMLYMTSKISIDGISYLLKGHWKNISELGFNANKLRSQQALKIVLMEYNLNQKYILCKVSGIDGVSSIYLKTMVNNRFPKVSIVL